VQGPDAADALDDATPTDRVVDLSKFEATVAAVDEVDSWVARTGYTGEDGFEVMCPAGDAETVWGRSLMRRATPSPAGSARATPSGSRWAFSSPGRTSTPRPSRGAPYEARIGFIVKLDTEFVGRDALEAQKEEGVDEQFVGIRLLERGVPETDTPSPTAISRGSAS